MQRAVLVDSGEPHNEVLFECRDGALGGIDPMIVGGGKVNVLFIVVNVHLNCFRAFIVHHVESEVIIAHGESCEDLSERVNHGTIILGGHGVNKDGDEIIHICHKNILH